MHLHIELADCLVTDFKHRHNLDVVTLNKTGAVHMEVLGPECLPRDLQRGKYPICIRSDSLIVLQFRLRISDDGVREQSIYWSIMKKFPSTAVPLFFLLCWTPG